MLRASEKDLPVLQTFLGLISRLNFSGPYGMKNYTLSKTADVSLRL